MKTLKVNLNNEAAVKAVLDEVQKRAKARTVSVNHIKYLKEKLEGKLSAMDIPKKYWKGCSVVYVEYVNCNSYNNKSRNADSTCVRVTCAGNNFFLTSCARVSLPTGRNGGNEYRYDFKKASLSAGFDKMLAKNNIRKID